MRLVWHPASRSRLACLLVLGLLATTGCGGLFIRDIATDALDPSNLADTEPSIAVNPLNRREIAIVTFSENWTATAGAPVWKSSDRGSTWRKVFQVVQPAAAGGPGDQKLDFDAEGRLHAAELDFTLSDYALRQMAVPDGLLAVGAAYGNDQPHLAVDGYATSPYKGRLYSPFLDFTVANPRSTLCWSTDRGLTMSCVGAGSNATFPNRTTRITVAPSGKVYVVYKIREGLVAGTPFENVHFTVQRSDDGGVTWAGLGPLGISVPGIDGS